MKIKMSDRYYKATYFSIVFSFTCLFLGIVSIPWHKVHAVVLPELISAASDGSQGNKFSSWSTVSADGRYVAFLSESTNFFANDTNDSYDIFVKDRQLGTIEHINVSSDGTPANGMSYSPSISADGRFIAFSSKAGNLVPGDTNNKEDIFVHDRQTKITERVNVTSTGIQSNNDAYWPSISDDGRTVAFLAYASNLVIGDTNFDSDVFVHDRHSGVTERVSVSSDGSQGSSGAYQFAMSANGKFVAFYSQAPNLILGDTNGHYDIFVHDRETKFTKRVSVAADGTQGNSGSSSPSISADGRYIAFYSQATNLAPDDSNSAPDIFVHDRQLETTTFVNLLTAGRLHKEFTLSDDGRFLAFINAYVSFLPGNTVSDILSLHDLHTNTTKRLTLGQELSLSKIQFNKPTFSANSQFLTFESGSPTILPNDTNNTYDIFLIQNELFPNNQPVNEAPELEAIGNRSVSEGQQLQFTINAIDPDGNNLIYTAVNLPAGATFNPQTRSFSWIPGFNQSGNYDDVEFTVTDDGNPIELDVELISITVGEVNRAPVIDQIDPKEIDENSPLSFTINATDPDGDSFTHSGENLPVGATFNPQTGVFLWTPMQSQAGNYIVTFHATDNGTPVEVGSKDVSITVGDVPTPIEQANNLITAIVSYNFPTNTENAYLANIKKLETFIEEGNIQASINQLNAFIGKVNKDYAQGNITQTVQDNLNNRAQTLLADLQ